MSKKTDIELTESQVRGSQLKDILMSIYYNLAVKIFKYEGLPEGVESNIIEKYLYENGQLLFCNDKQLGFLTLPASAHTMLNVYGRANKYWANGHGYRKTFSILPEDKQAVLIRNNESASASIRVVEFYTTLLQNIEWATQVNLNACKTPLVFQGTGDELLAFKNLYKKVTGNEPVIYVDKSLGEKAFDVKKSNAEFLGDKFNQVYNNIESKILTYFGLKNLNSNKKERLITAEAEENNELISANLSAMFNERKQGFERVNKMFNLNIVVSINDEIFENDNITLNEEGDNNGELHNRT